MVEEVRDQFNGVKVFSATKARDRDQLGDRVTEWIKHHQDAVITDTCVTQSSDSEFHCLSIVLFYVDPARGR